MPERLNTTIQENTITLLVHSDKYGGAVAKMVDPTLFEGEYRVVAERASDYWRQYKKPPGYHMSDLLDDVLKGGDDTRTKRRRQIMRNILNAMEHGKDQVNATYVIDTIGKFVRLQTMKATLIKSIERLNGRQEMAIDEVEQMWNELLHARQANFEPGTRLTDIDKFIDFAAERDYEFDFGIRELDMAGIVPARQTQFVLIAPPNVGKTWACIHVAKRALRRGKRVLHISNEMVEESVQRRYYQALFSVPKREAESVERTRFVRNDDGKVVGFKTYDVTPEFTLVDEKVRREIESRLKKMGGLTKNLIIKNFPQRSLTFDGYQMYLDNLEQAERFIPDLVIIDYPAIMKIPLNDFRLRLGRLMEDLRGCAIERNHALFTPHQAGRKSEGAKFVTREHVAEDFSIVMTADNIVTMSATHAEARSGLARLFVDKGREDKSKFGSLIIQNYEIGQFCLDSSPLPHDYFDKLQPKRGSINDADEDESGGDE